MLADIREPSFINILTIAYILLLSSLFNILLYQTDISTTKNYVVVG